MKRTIASTITALAIAVSGVVSAPAAHATDFDPNNIVYSTIVDADIATYGAWYTAAGASAWSDGSTTQITVDFVNPLDVPFQSESGYIPLIHAIVPGCDQFNLYEPDTTIAYQYLPRNGVDDALLHVIFSTDAWNCDLSTAPSLMLSGTFTHRYFNTSGLTIGAGYLVGESVSANAIDFIISGVPSNLGSMVASFTDINNNADSYFLGTMVTSSSILPSGQTNVHVSLPQTPTGSIWRERAFNVSGRIDFQSAVSPTAIADAFAGTPLIFGTQTTTYDKLTDTLNVSVDATNTDPTVTYSATITAIQGNGPINAFSEEPGGTFTPGQTRTLSFVVTGPQILNSDLTSLTLSTATHPVVLSTIDGAGISGYWNCCIIVSNVTAREVADVGGGSHLDVFADVENAGNQVNKLHWGTPATNGTTMTNIGSDLLVAPNQKIVGTRVGSISQTQSWLGELLTINSPSDGYANSNLYRVDLLAPHDSDFYNDRTAHCILNTQTDQWDIQTTTDGTYHEGDGSTLVQVTSNNSQTCGIFAMRHFNVLVDGTNDGVTLLSNQDRTAIYTPESVYDQNGWHAIAKVAPERAVSETGGLQATLSYSTEYSPMLDFTAVEQTLDGAGFVHSNAHIVGTADGIKVMLRIASSTPGQSKALRLGTVKIGSTTLSPPMGTDITQSVAPLPNGYTNNDYTNVVLGTISYDDMFALQSGAVTLSMSDNRNSYDFTDTNAALRSAGLPTIQSILEDNSTAGSLFIRATFCSESRQEGDYTLTDRTIDLGNSTAAGNGVDELFSIRASNGYCTAEPVWFIGLTGSFVDRTFPINVEMFSNPLSSIAFDVPSSDGFSIGASDIQLSERGIYTATINYNNSSGGVFYAHVDLNLYDENNVLVDQIIDARREFESGAGTFWTFALADQMLHGHNLTVRGTITAYDPSTVTNTVQLSPAVNLYLSGHAIFDRELNSQTRIQYSLLNTSESTLLALIDLKAYDINNNVVASYTGSEIIDHGSNTNIKNLLIPGDVGDGQAFEVRGDITTVSIPNCGGEESECPWNISSATFSGLSTSTPQIIFGLNFYNDSPQVIGYGTSFVFKNLVGEVNGALSTSFTVDSFDSRHIDWTVNLTSHAQHHSLSIEGTTVGLDVVAPTQSLSMPAGVALQRPIALEDVRYNAQRDTSVVTLYLTVPYFLAPNTYNVRNLQIGGLTQGIASDTSNTCIDAPRTTASGKTCTIALTISEISGDLRLYMFGGITGALTLLSGKTPTSALSNCACVSGSTMTIATKGAGVVYSAKKKVTTVAATFKGVKGKKYKIKAGSIKLTYYVTEKVRGKLRKVKKTATLTLKAQTIKATGKAQSLVVFTIKNLNLKAKATNIVISGKFTVTAG